MNCPWCGESIPEKRWNLPGRRKGFCRDSHMSRFDDDQIIKRSMDIFALLYEFANPERTKGFANRLKKEQDKYRRLMKVAHG